MPPPPPPPPEIAWLLTPVILPCWSTVILADCVLLPYVPGVTPVSAKFTVTVPDVPPPLIPVPAVTPSMSPLPPPAPASNVVKSTLPLCPVRLITLPLSVKSWLSVSLVMNELRSGGVYVYTPVPLLYANAPVPLALIVTALKSVSCTPSAPSAPSLPLVPFDPAGPVLPVAPVGP